MVRGKVFPHPRPYEDFRYLDFEEYETPEWQMLAINRQVRVEAAEIFLKENHFVFHGGTAVTLESSYMVSKHDWCFPENENDLRALCTRYLRSISLSFDVRSDPSPHTMAVLLRNTRVPPGWWALSDDMQRTDADRTAHCHILASDLAWNKYQDIMSAMRRIQHLDFAQLDLTYCYCPLTCCRLDKAVAVNLDIGEWDSKSKVPNLEFIGIKSNADREELVRDIAWCGNIFRNWLEPADVELPVVRFKVFPKQRLPGEEFTTNEELEDALIDEDFDVARVLDQDRKCIKAGCLDKEWWDRGAPPIVDWDKHKLHST